MVSTRLLSGPLSVALLVFGLVASLPYRACACCWPDFGGSPQQRAERMLGESNTLFAGRVVEFERSSRVYRASSRHTTNPGASSPRVLSHPSEWKARSPKFGLVSGIK